MLKTNRDGMRLLENRVADDNLHRALLDTPLFPSVQRGKLCAELYLPEWLTVNGGDVGAYGYPVGRLVDRWLNDHVCGAARRLDRDGVRGAAIIVADLEAMVKKLLGAIAEAVYVKD